MLIRSFGSGLPGVWFHYRWSRHGFGLDLHNRGLADTEIGQRRPGASRIHELLPKIHPEICQGDPSTDRITKEIRDISRQETGRLSQMGIDSGSRVGIPKTEQDLHWSTDPPAFRSGQANHSPNGCEWIRDCGHSQSVQCFRGSQASQFLLREALSSQTELRHLWSGAIGPCGNTKPVAALPRGRQSQGLNSVRPPVSRLLPDIQSDLQKTSQVVGNPFGLQLCYRGAGWQQGPCRWPIQTTRLRDWLREACGPTIGNRPSGTIWWPHASNYCGSGFWLLGCRHLSKASRLTSCRRHRYRGGGDSMVSRRGGIDLRGEDIRSCGQFSTPKCDKSIPWQSWVRSFWCS